MHPIDRDPDCAGKRKRHELTGLEIKLLTPTGKGWRAQVVSTNQSDYIVNLTTEDLNRRFVDVVEE